MLKSSIIFLYYILNDKIIMITEDYVSFEIAKLLKEKGFDSENVSEFGGFYIDYYHTGQYVGISTESTMLNKTISYWEYLRPTLQMAMKWLREVHNLVIEPYRTACGYLYTISNIPYGSTKYDNCEAYNGDDEDSGQWTTWEKACEDGIKYCLENLI